MFGNSNLADASYSFWSTVDIPMQNGLVRNMKITTKNIRFLEKEKFSTGEQTIVDMCQNIFDCACTVQHYYRSLIVLADGRSLLDKRLMQWFTVQRSYAIYMQLLPTLLKSCANTALSRTGPPCQPSFRDSGL